MSQTQIRGSSQIKDGSITDAKLASTFIKQDGSVAFGADQSLGGNKLTNVADPVSAQDAATKAYVDATSQGLDVKASVRVATTANITLSGTQTIDGVAVIAGDRVLVKNQSTGNQNGIYVVAAGAWSRATDADANSEVTAGMFVFVEEGTVSADTGWVLTTNGAITLGSTSLTFTQFSGAGAITAGQGLTQTGTTLDVGAGNGIASDADSVRVVVDGSSLSLGGSGVRLNMTTFVIREAPSGSINGSNVTFTLANTPYLGSEMVFLNGVLQDQGGSNDYTISTATITFNTAPATGDKLLVTYLKNV